MLPESEELQTAFSGEDHDEDQIDQIQNLFLLGTLLVCFHHHGHHVETDQHHDEDVKKLLCNQVKNHTLAHILKHKHQETRTCVNNG